MNDKNPDVENTSYLYWGNNTTIPDVNGTLFQVLCYLILLSGLCGWLEEYCNQLGTQVPLAARTRGLNELVSW